MDYRKFVLFYNVRRIRFISSYCWGCLHGVMVKALDCSTVIHEFKLQSCYYTHFQTNTLRKDMNPLILLSIG